MDPTSHIILPSLTNSLGPLLSPLQWRRFFTQDSHGPAPANAMARRPPSMAAVASPLLRLAYASWPRGSSAQASGASARRSTRARAREPGPQPWHAGAPAKPLLDNGN